MTVGEYLLGLSVLAGTWGGALAAGWIVVSRRLPGLNGATRVLAVALVATAALVLAELLPALVGLLSRWTALGVALALVAIAWRTVARAPGAPRDDTPPPVADSGLVSWAVAGLAVVAVGVWTVAKLWASSRSASEDVDTLTFHLPNIARWLQSGSIWQVDQYTPLLANGNYPHNGDLVFMSVLAPFESDAFVRAVGTPFVVLAGLSVYAIGRELGAPRATAVLGAALFAALPVVTYASFDGAKTDPVMWACFGAGAFFAVRALRLRRTSDLVLAGLGVGLAFGTKWYGAPAAAVMVAAWAGAALLRGHGARAVLRGGAVLVSVAAAAGGFWLVRNAIESGSPLFPVSIPPLWDTPRDLIRECAGYRIVDYLVDGRIWSDYVLPAYRDNYGLGGAVLLAGWLAAAGLVVAALVRDRGRSPSVPPGAGLLVTAVAGLAAAYAVTPYTALGPKGDPVQVGANTRWLGPALLLAAPLLAWAIGRLGRVRPVAEVVLLIAVADGIRRAFGLPAHTVGAAAAALALAAGGAYGVFVVRDRLPRGRALAAAAPLLALVALLAIGYVRQRDYQSDRFARSDDVVIEYLAERARSGHRVGIAGVPSVDGLAPVWPAFGPRLGNDVEFVGRTVDGQLREYADRGEWTRAVRRGGFDLILVARGGYSPQCPVPGSESDDDAWARAAGFRPLASSPRLTLYGVTRGMIGAR